MRSWYGRWDDMWKSMRGARWIISCQASPLVVFVFVVVVVVVFEPWLLLLFWLLLLVEAIVVVCVVWESLMRLEGGTSHSSGIGCCCCCCWCIWLLYWLLRFGLWESCTIVFLFVRFFVDRKYFWRDGKLFSAKLFKGPLEKNGCYFWKCSADSSSSACVVSKPKNVANAATQWSKLWCTFWPKNAFEVLIDVCCVQCARNLWCVLRAMCALCNFYYWSVTSVKNFCVFLMLFVDATLCFSAFDAVLFYCFFFVVRTFK